jgi:ribosomal protein S18 acetylase RimI-like enzyme
MFEKFKPNIRKIKIAFKIIEAKYSHLNEITKITFDREHRNIDKIKKELETYLLNDKARLYVAISKGKVVGFAKSKKYSGEDFTYEGWYLSGVIVKPEYRGAGIGKELTYKRLCNLKSITKKIYYLANSNNKVSIKLHNSFGFSKLTESFTFPGVKFKKGSGCLYVVNTNNL